MTGKKIMKKNCGIKNTLIALAVLMITTAVIWLLDTQFSEVHTKSLHFA